jgi:glutathione S-transferase
VPALRRDDGSILTECAPILLYIADQVPAHRLAPRIGSEARYRTLEWLNFIATELHKNFITPERHEGRGANFLPRTRSGQRDVTARVSPRLSHVERQLAGSKYLVDGNFSAPDAYLFTMLTWAIRLGMDLAAWQNLQAFHARVAALDPVRMALAAEGPPHSLAAERA